MLIQRVDDLLSVPASSPADAQALARHVKKSGDWLEVVAGIDSVIVRYDTAKFDPDTAEQRLAVCLTGDIEPIAESARVIDIPVVYGGEYGPDLEDVCLELGMSQEEFIDLHAGREYLVDMVGFTPGFAFVGGLDDRLNVPRRKDPRQRVEAGSIGIADGRTGMYAVASPGGWNLVGRTPYALFDSEADQPFPISAGMRVRYVAISAAELNT